MADLHTAVPALQPVSSPKGVGPFLGPPRDPTSCTVCLLFSEKRLADTCPFLSLLLPFDAFGLTRFLEQTVLCSVLPVRLASIVCVVACATP